VPRQLTALTGAALLAALALAPAALAQGQPKKTGDDAVRMPSPRKAEEPPTLFIYFIVLVILGVVFGANMIPSKRGHQD
jgi:hypothetical protein